MDDLLNTHMIKQDFNSVVSQILNETDEVGRAYRQVKSDANKFKADRTFNIRRTYDSYKKAQERANRLEKSSSNKVTINHTVSIDRLKVGIDILHVLKYLLSKANEEISVSVIKPKFTAASSRIVLHGATVNLHDWYPMDAFTSSDKKEKTALYVSSDKEKDSRGVSQYDEGITNLKDVSWTSFSIHINRKDLEQYLTQFYQAKSFLEKQGLVHKNPFKTSTIERLPNGKEERYEYYPLTGYLKSYIDENNEITNWEEVEGAGNFQLD